APPKDRVDEGIFVVHFINRLGDPDTAYFRFKNDLIEKAWVGVSLNRESVSIRLKESVQSDNAIEKVTRTSSIKIFSDLWVAGVKAADARNAALVWSPE